MNPRASTWSFVSSVLKGGFPLSRNFYVRTHVKISRQWKSTLRLDNCNAFISALELSIFIFEVHILVRRPDNFAITPDPRGFEIMIADECPRISGEHELHVT